MFSDDAPANPLVEIRRSQWGTPVGYVGEHGHSRSIRRCPGGHRRAGGGGGDRAAHRGPSRGSRGSPAGGRRAAECRRARGSAGLRVAAALDRHVADRARAPFPYLARRPATAQPADDRHDQRGAAPAGAEGGRGYGAVRVAATSACSAHSAPPRGLFNDHRAPHQRNRSRRARRGAETAEEHARIDATSIFPWSLFDCAISVPGRRLRATRP